MQHTGDDAQPDVGHDIILTMLALTGAHEAGGRMH
ncbi:hypothetical protein NOV72_05323 [Caballeronia novacaledonica]|uniref:Uncharacterized protein n=1 Tax=Caballeronia novacaledonica TaxID=1544861 RepID=A0A2U3ID25_9BURK|nr:hypothetical protein NOV72_05323 [Caballeronia novacaledonica]